MRCCSFSQMFPCLLHLLMVVSDFLDVSFSYVVRYSRHIASCDVIQESGTLLQKELELIETIP